MKGLLADFKDFILKGNLVTTAVALVIALVFSALVKALVADLITPIIALIFGKPNFANLTFTINNSEFKYGDFINALITFASVAAAVFFFVIKPYETVIKRFEKPDTSIKHCPECTMEIPAQARRCPQCTAVLGGGAEAGAV
ncbi:MAG TPA: large conductance mechanosensitive channel protein MscL [Solirubrobacteraceae bacterium]|nr:large conductance mechanosensitive channel protein MscL [Solirubrobacteraceae bacterium]